MSEPRFDMEEYDEAGDLVASYIQSFSKRSETEVARVDVVVPSTSNPISVWNMCIDVFLPAGYPHSVTDDYLKYQIYVCARVLLRGQSLSIIIGLFTGIFKLNGCHAKLKSCLGGLEPECKMYRLAADFLNDSAMILDCLSPVFPKPIRVLVFSLSSILRALCGVAAGSSKASLSAHFAKWGNLGELNAKDSSQETVISLMGMLVGSVLVSRISTPFLTWTAMLVLLTIHLFMNASAVRAVSMRSLNRQRANIVFSHLLAYDKVLSPKEVSKRERIFERDGVFRGARDQVIGYGKIGVSLQQLMKAMSRSPRTTTGSVTLRGNELAKLLDLYKTETYILWFDWEVSTVYIVLKQGSTAQSQLKAWSQGLLLAQRAAADSGDRDKDSENLRFTRIVSSLEQTSKRFDEDIGRLRAAGWDVDVCALETRSGTRLVCK
ncbi:hypothetical protein EG328_009313 [Venturia inaequalis]|uniref:DUF647-domain-containing protein n=1 Tax=Venturia inaequalis TaxID=5025 RepID=A0A8H3UW03_VENIN|nr:hypothetical protein EG328_009313 [Venturia inaequalis]KAE9975784.1 hypothetical protein EG327_008332 [Venturia inaequalis]